MGIQVGFASPAPGSAVPTTFTVSGSWGDDGQPPPVPDGVFTLRQIFVRYAPGIPGVNATINSDGTWTATSSLPGGVHHGDAVAVTFLATVIMTSNDNPE